MVESGRVLKTQFVEVAQSVSVAPVQVISDDPFTEIESKHNSVESKRIFTSLEKLVPGTVILKLPVSVTVTG